MKISPIRAIRNDQSQSKLGASKSPSNSMTYPQNKFAPSFNGFYFKGKPIDIFEINKLNKKDLFDFAERIMGHDNEVIEHQCDVWRE